MANRPTSLLTTADPLALADLFALTQGGNSRKATGEMIVDMTQLAEERVLVNLGPFGKITARAAEILATLDGASVTLTDLVPANSLLLGATAFVISGLTGSLTSFEVGVSGDTDRFGTGIGITTGSSNIGIVAPYVVSSPQSIVLTAIGGTGSGNSDKIRIVVFFIEFDTPSG
jgi:hypothetical protein